MAWLSASWDAFGQGCLCTQLQSGFSSSSETALIKGTDDSLNPAKRGSSLATDKPDS